MTECIYRQTYTDSEADVHKYRRTYRERDIQIYIQTYVQKERKRDIHRYRQSDRQGGGQVARLNWPSGYLERSSRSRDSRPRHTKGVKVVLLVHVLYAQH